MGAFAQGFQMGGSMYDSAERNRLLKEQLDMAKAKDAREAESHDMQMRGLRRIDDATNALSTATSAGIRNQANMDANDADFDQAVAATGRGLAMPQAAPQLPEWRPASDLELNKLQMGLAAAKGDMAGMETLRKGRMDLEWAEGLKNHGKAWDEMDDAAKGKLITDMSNRADVHGFGSWVPGTGKTAGYMNYMAPGKDPVKLTANEARQLYVISNMMGQDPVRAQAEMEKMTDKVRSIAKDAFSAQTEGVKANNTAAHYANTDAAAAERNNILRDAQSQQVYGATHGYTVDANGKLTPTISGLRFDRKTGGYSTISAPLQSPNFVPDSALDPAKIGKTAEAMVGMPTGQKDSSGKDIRYTLETAYAAAQAQAVRGYTGQAAASPVNDIAAAILKNQKPGGGQTAPAQPTAAPTQPTAAPAQALGISRPARGFEGMHADVTAELRRVSDAIPQIEAQAQAVARSGDTQAIIRYGNALNAARARQKELTEKLRLYSN